MGTQQEREAEKVNAGMERAAYVAELAASRAPRMPGPALNGVFGQVNTGGKDDANHD